MRPRRFPLLSAAGFIIALAVFALSFQHRQIYPARLLSGLASEPAWSVHLEGGRAVASRHHPLSSIISLPARPAWWNAFGFSHERRRFPAGGIVGGKIMCEHLAVPLYPLPLLAGLLLALRIHRLRNFSTSGRCEHCGYDLRATPDRCPECGAIPRSESRPRS